jgi:hypothetical protein
MVKAWSKSSERTTERAVSSIILSNDRILGTLTPAPAAGPGITAREQS